MPTPDQVYNFLRGIAADPDSVPKPSQLQPAKRQYSRPLQSLQKVPVRLLVASEGKPHHRAKKPTTLAVGTTVYASLGPDGTVRLFPFMMAGTGYEIVTDAIEGKDFEFFSTE